MLASTGHHTSIQNNNNNSTKWGFKVWLECSSNRFVYSFDIYIDKKDLDENIDGLGIGWTVVMTIIANLPKRQNYTIIADWFITKNLAEAFLKNVYQFCDTMKETSLNLNPNTIFVTES